MSERIDRITPEVIAQNMRHAHELRAHAMLDAFDAVGRAIRKGLYTVVSIFA